MLLLLTLLTAMASTRALGSDLMAFAGDFSAHLNAELVVVVTEDGGNLVQAVDNKMVRYLGIQDLANLGKGRSFLAHSSA